MSITERWGTVSTWSCLLTGAGAVCALASTLVLLVPLALNSTADDALVQVLVRAEVPQQFAYSLNPKVDADGHLGTTPVLQEDSETRWAGRFATQRRHGCWAAALAAASALFTLASMLV